MSHLRIARKLYDCVLELMKEVAEDEDSSDISGYHSDSDSAIMMSGNSPYVSKRARHNFLTRSVRSSSNCSARTRLMIPSTGSSSESPPEQNSTTGTNWDWTNEKSPEIEVTNVCPNCGPQSTLISSQNNRELISAQTELETTKAELERAKSKIEALTKSVTYNSTAQKELSAQRLVRCYGNLYSQGRVNALEALDAIPQLQGADELKSKILFSIVVLAFRSTQALLQQKKEQVKQLLFNHTPSNPSQTELETAITTYLRRTVDSFDISSCITEVSAQLWATLYDYPCLKTCTGLLQYIKDSVRLAWALTNQIPAFILEYEQRTFRRDLHVRFHTSKSDNDQIRTYLWPALLEGAGGPCVHKAVVLT
ncbi:hypothetical protein V9T40_013963 [Parthenolecanium corni]|uniref:Mitochondria-eating protein n=1 Tax=Parthenolecanium corni TaxID=536013 RepID=A0AAN9Y2Z7_9HEMI